jgi:DNA-binding transcriptional LysR family regulator
MTHRQKEILDAYIKAGSKQGAADAIGCSRSTVRRAIEALEARGEVPWMGPAPKPEHLNMSKTTVQYGKHGEVLQEWRRLNPTAQMLSEVVEGLCEDVKGKGKAKPRATRKTDSDDILFEIDLFDAHVGMYADERETLGEDYDCDIAAKRMIEATEGIASRASRPKKCVLVFGGDMLHSDNRRNQTEHAGNVLDVDSRFHRVVSYIIAASKDAVQIAASIAESVEIVILQGNHSWHSEAWLAQVLNAYYCTCPNITVHLEQSPRRKMVWGDNLICWAHGDRVPAQKWPMIIASEFAKEWGITNHRYLRCGHIHSQKTIAPVIVQEQSGLLVEFVPALCATDAWHAESGYVGSQRGATAVEYHKSGGKISSFFQPV